MSAMSRNFFNLYSHDFARVAVGVPSCKVADPAFNAAQTIELAKEAAAHGAVLVAFPELGVSAYTCDDLFHQRALLDACEDALQSILDASKQLDIAMIVGAPVRAEHKLFNCAIVIAGGFIRGVVPKSYLPNYGEFYEARQFSPADAAAENTVTLCGQDVPFGASLLFQIEDLPLFRFHVEICEDVWVPIPPSSFAALAGATVLVNLSASNIVVGKSAYRHQLVGQQSARCVAAYLYIGGQWRIVHRSRLGRARPHLRKRRAAGGVRALLGPVAPHLRRYRSRTPLARTHAANHVRPLDASPRRRSRAIRRDRISTIDSRR